ncbi:MAG: tyrosine-type recombinase/integrase [Thermoplasmata archaeon]
MDRIGIGRGLTMDECLRLCKAPRRLPANATKFRIWMALRDELLTRLLYETWTRVSELLKIDIRDVDFDNCSIFIRHPKGRAVFRIEDGRRVHVDTVHQQRQVFFSDHTRDLIIRFLQRRKRGPLITNSRRKRLSTRQAERIVDRHARAAGVQRVVGYDRKGREIRLVTCKALREAGERHTDIAGGDRDATARVAGHTVRTKEKHYKKGNFEEDRRIVREHHPLMREEGMGNQK